MKRVVGIWPGFVLLLMVAKVALGAGPTLVEDINPMPAGGSATSNAVVAGDFLYFVAFNEHTGTELWRTDGTAAGTILLKDLHTDTDNYPGEFFSLVEMKGLLFFGAIADGVGYGLWRSDGTPEGTLLVHAMPFGPPARLTNVNGILYFMAVGFDLGIGLWKSDGTEAGTVLVKNISPSGINYNSNLINLNGTLLFTAYTPTEGGELWRSDGTEAGTTLLKDINPGSNSSRPGDPAVSSRSVFAIVNDTLYFPASTPTTGVELWKTDGTETGTVLVKDINPGPGSSRPGGVDQYGTIGCFVNVSGTLFFSAGTPSNGVELWKSDGTEAGTVLVKDMPGQGGLYPGESSYGYGGRCAAVNNRLFFVANQPTTGTELWVSDGTSEGTFLVKDINPGTYSSSLDLLTSFTNQLFFTVSYWSTPGIWRSDGTPDGTIVLKKTSLNGFIIPWKDSLFFAADGGIWQSDGTVNGTVLIANVGRGTGGSYVRSLAAISNRVLFTAFDGTAPKLWQSDGTEDGTSLVKNVPEKNSLTGSFAKVNNQLFFAMTNAGMGELWKTDGTPKGTLLVKGMFPSSKFPIGNFIDVNGTLFFTAFQPKTGVELWKSNGTKKGTVLVKDINPGPQDSKFYNFINVNGMLYFTVYTPSLGVELWQSNGTEKGTRLVKDILPGPGDSRPYELTDVNGTLFFAACQLDTGCELWKSDGSEGGTVLVKDIFPGTASSYPRSFKNVEGLLFFAIYDPQTGYQLWRSDGTEGGTFRVGQLPSFIGPGVSFRGQLFFSATTPDTGTELWRSDGQTADRFLDIYPGPAGSQVQSLTVVDDLLIFTANDGLHGWELWSSDGIDKVGMIEIAPGPGSSAPSNFTVAGNNLFFVADDGVTGRELWVMPIAALHDALNN